MRFREIEKIILDDGWTYKGTKGSHYHYIHPTKPGKVTIPHHTGDLDSRTIKSILKQARAEITALASFERRYNYETHLSCHLLPF